jgi:rRNA processing protein Krr1/Pno1
MTKRERALNFAREFKRTVAKEVAKRERESKRKAFADVVAKGKIETYGDLFAILGKLSRRAKDYAAINEVQRLASMGYDPKKIVEFLEPKKRPQKENVNDRSR